MLTHWWRCTGACRRRPPHFGFVKRSMNRAPGRNDFWWRDHQASCGGTFEKIREPEGYGKKKGKKEIGELPCPGEWRDEIALQCWHPKHRPQPAAPDGLPKSNVIRAVFLCHFESRMLNLRKKFCHFLVHCLTEPSLPSDEIKPTASKINPYRDTAMPI